MHEQYIKNLLGIKDEHLKIRRIMQENDQMHIYMRYLPGHYVCPICGAITSKIHDYRERIVKHGMINGYFGIIHYQRRRYVCKSCGSKFPEANGFVSPYAKISNLTKQLILKEATHVLSFKHIASTLNISSSTVIRHIDRHIQPKRLEFPETLSFDEFKKTNLGYGKYAFVIVDPIHKKVIDVIKNRRSDWLINYFSQIPYEERCNVKNIIMDLWAPYKTIVKQYFPQARIIADGFHFLRYIYRAFNDVRVRIMKSHSTDSIPYKILKRHWRTLLKSPDKLNLNYRYHALLDDHVNDLMIHDYAANIHPDLEEAMILKDFFQTGMKTKTYEEAESFIENFILLLDSAHTKEFREIRKTFVNWKKEIIESFDLHPLTDKKMTNGIIEGINNFIKVIKRVSYGFRNFNRFRNRIMFVFNKDYQLIG